MADVRRNDALADIAVGHDPLHALAIGDEHGGYTLADHLLRRLADRCGRTDAHRGPRYQAAHRLSRGSPEGLRLRLQRQPVGKRADEPRIEFLVATPGLGKGLAIEVVDERVFKCHGVIARQRVVHERRKTEAVAFRQPRHHLAGFVAQLDGTAAHDVQAAVLHTDLQDIVAVPVVPNVDVPGAG